MNLRLVLLVIACFFICSLHFNCASPSTALRSTLMDHAQLSGINTLLKSAGGLNTVMGKGKKPFTLLAPTNNALAELGPGTVETLLKSGNKEMLVALLKKHVLPGKFNQDQIRAGGLKDITGNELNLGNTRITESIQTKGGMIQVIDKVLN
jgi:uncharacterized surface protein with fasciclin (FAS1) repeats